MVDDDAPIAGTQQTLVLSNAFSNSGTADLDFTMGADGPSTTTPFTLTAAQGATPGTQVPLAEGNAVYGSQDGGTSYVQLTSTTGEVTTDLVWHDNGDGSWSAVLAGTAGTQQDEDATVFTVTVNSDGTYTVSLDDNLVLDGVGEPFTLDFTDGGVSGGNNDQLIFFDSKEDDVNPADGIPDGSTIMAVAPTPSMSTMVGG
jgi:hypothetical protein